jgi:antitoxin (DNA-binding transcriptional repressor) of toxin-antitoxin stability system
LRQAVREEQVIVTDHGRPVAAVSAYPGQPANGGGFRNRVLLPAYEAVMNQPAGGTDSTEIISQGREDRL